MAILCDDPQAGSPQATLLRAACRFTEGPNKLTKFTTLRSTAAMDSVNPRFRSAILAARSLHPDLLTQPQKLKLYALFRQSQGAAPADPPADPTPLAQAKWEAWRDVRGLSQQEAMDAYSEIIEGLTGLMAALGPNSGGPPPPDMRSDGQARVAAAARQRSEEEEEEEEEEEGEEEDDEEEYDEEDEDYDEEDEDDNEPEPEVSQTVWQTESVNVAAGDTFEVPLAFDAPSKCSYSLTILPGSTGPIGFKIYATQGFASELSSEVPVVAEYSSSLDATVEVAPPGGGSGALRISLDNTASTFSSIDVKVRVCLEPLREILALDHYRSRQALRGLIQRKAAALAQHCAKQRGIEDEAQSLQSRLEALRLDVARVEGELRLRHKQIEQGAEMAELMGGELSELRQQLRTLP